MATAGSGKGHVTGRSKSQTVSTGTSANSSTNPKVRNSSQSSNVQSKITELEHLSRSDLGANLLLSPKANISTSESLIDVNLLVDDIVSAKRMGKITKFRKNRPISIQVKGEEARDKILKSRGKLKQEIVNTPIWINEELPQTYRRRKAMLRDLVKLAQARKYKAKIDQGGINLDGKLYLPHQFQNLREGLQPKDACSRATEDGGLAFVSEWSPFSNLYRTNFIYHGIWFNSVEQCYQFRKSNAEGHEDTAELILSLTDPYQCKKEGKLHKESKEWEKVCEYEMSKIVAAKFHQNEGIMETLMEIE